MNFIIRSFRERPGNTLRIAENVVWILIIFIGFLVDYIKEHSRKQ